jgi:hypothetical protein
VRWDSVADTVPEVAVTVAVPFATAVTSPDEDTVATLEFEVVHTIVGEVMTEPPASFTVGTADSVSPIDDPSIPVGVRVMLAASWTN